MGHLNIYCEKFNSDVGGIFLRCQGQSDERDNFSLVFMPQRLEVSLATIDDNEECFPAMVSSRQILFFRLFLFFNFAKVFFTGQTQQSEQTQQAAHCSFDPAR